MEHDAYYIQYEMSGAIESVSASHTATVTLSDFARKALVLLALPEVRCDLFSLR